MANTTYQLKMSMFLSQRTCCTLLWAFSSKHCSTYVQPRRAVWLSATGCRYRFKIPLYRHVQSMMKGNPKNEFIYVATFCANVIQVNRSLLPHKPTAKLFSLSKSGKCFPTCHSHHFPFSFQICVLVKVLICFRSAHEPLLHLGYNISVIIIIIFKKALYSEKIIL